MYRLTHHIFVLRKIGETKQQQTSPSRNENRKPCKGKKKESLEKVEEVEGRSYNLKWTSIDTTSATECPRFTSKQYIDFAE